MKKSNLKAVISYTKGYRLPLIISFVLLGVEMLVSFVSPLVMSVTIDSVLDDKPLRVPQYFARFINEIGGVELIKKNIWIMALILLCMQLFLGVIRFSRARCNAQAGEGVTKKLRDRFYAHIQRLPFSYHANVQTGDIIQRATNDIEVVRRFITAMMLELIRTIFMLLVGLVVMASLNIPLTLITGGMVIPIAACSVIFFNKINKQAIAQEEVEGAMYTVIQENLTGMRVVRAFGRERFEMEKFDEQNELNRIKVMDINKTFATLWTTLDILCGTVIGLIMVLGIYYTVKGSMTIGLFTAFSQYVFMFFWPIRGFGRILNAFSRTLVSTGRIEEVFAATEEEGLDEGKEPDLSGDIVFDKVEFAYDKVPVLKELSLTIPGGKTVAFLGGTGSGKSTLALLLQRLYDLNGGSISIGGTNIAEIKKTYLRDHIGIVLQEPFLYSKSILENIGIKQSSPSREDVEHAAMAAAIHADITEFEDGYETVVGERGVTLSGGQKQRVAIARALMGDSNMLIFDDSLSAVDTRTDSAIRDALKERRSGVTTLIISHRITTLMEADKIFVLKDGAVVEEGSHRELMEIGGIYRRTYDIQSANVMNGGDVE